MIRLLGTTEKKGEIYLFYSYAKQAKYFFKIITSSDGFEFNGLTKYVIVTDAKGREEPKYDWTDFLVTQQKQQYVVTYKVNTKGNDNLYIATSEQMLRWKKIGKIENIKEVGSLIPDYQHRNRHVLYFGEKDIKLAYSSQLEKWKIEEQTILQSREGFFDHGALQVAKVYNEEDHILLFYYVKHTYAQNTHYSVGAAGIDKKDPTKVLWRLDKPLWETPDTLKHEPMRPLGIEKHDGQLISYWVINDTSVYAVSSALPGKGLSIKEKHAIILLKKHEQNPIIAPNPAHKWESRATFNSAALYEDGKVHFVYRALGDSDLSVLGYASSSDGITIDERSDDPIYIPREPFETPGGNAFNSFADHFVSGGGYGGVEDPRITKIDDTIYMTYVAFDGANPPRVALTSIPVKDFLGKQWDKWKKPKLISAPGMVNKNAVIFPEKINGKYVIFHRVYPNILVDVVDDLDFNGTYLQGQYFIPPRKNYWDSKKIGAGAPPIKTKDGWLFIYQSVGKQDPGRYKIGAMLLDKNDPTKVLYRANNPIVSPDAHYENNGFKAGVVYPCGAVVKDNTLLVYYGGADTVVCAAQEDLDVFLKQMKQTQEPKLRRVKSPIF
jgi:predicted GH43/DUF377 family glycosyl hydrolase